MTKAIVFDFFGTICLDLYWTWLKIHVPDLESRRRYFQELSNQLDLGKITREQFARTLSAKTGVAEEDVLVQMDKGILIDPELVELIKALKKNYKIGLLSNSNAHWLREILKNYKLDTLFDAIVISQEVGFIKPHREIFEITLKELELKPEEIVFIDDREKNTKAAEEQGIKTIVFKGVEELKEKPVLTLLEVTEVLKIHGLI